MQDTEKSLDRSLPFESKGIEWGIRKRQEKQLAGYPQVIVLNIRILARPTSFFCAYTNVENFDESLLLIGFTLNINHVQMLI